MEHFLCTQEPQNLNFRVKYRSCSSQRKLDVQTVAFHHLFHLHQPHKTRGVGLRETECTDYVTSLGFLGI